MNVLDTEFEGVKIIEPTVFPDERGYFFESFNLQRLKEHGIPSHFVQDNEAKSSYGVLRGLHYQIPPFDQAKLVRVVVGEVLDVIVDIRPEYPTYGRVLIVTLSEENKRQLFVPRGFAHGYIVTSTEAIFTYKCDNYYSKKHEGGILYSDPALDIDWRIPEENIVVSDKDREQPFFSDHLPFILSEVNS